MSRRREIQPREIMIDPQYQSESVAKFINIIMYSGKKSVAEGIVYQSLEKIGGKVKGLDIFNTALENIKPPVEVRSRRVGGANYQVPVEVRSSRQRTLAMRWIVDAARKRSGHSMVEKLSAELLDASNNRGVAAKRREETLKMAEANKAFSHYRW